VQVVGVMTLDDQAALQSAARVLIARGLKPRVLAVLDGFGGWAKGQDWGDVTFLSEHGDDIARMAIVGEERWRDDALMFVAKGLRTTGIEYFTPDHLARARQWLNQRQL
jgi:hypothetical protein